MGTSLPQMHSNLKAWVNSLVRIDKWSLDPPTELVTRLQDGASYKNYPANAAIMYPAQRVEYEASDFGIVCQADFLIGITYKFSRQLQFHQLPVYQAEGILNNLYFYAVTQAGDISRDILRLATPDLGADVLVQPYPPNADQDWLITIQPFFRITFKGAIANTDDLQPGTQEPVLDFNQLTIGVYRSATGEVGNDDESRLDRTIVIQENTP